MSDEKLRILRMIEEGKLTAREGLELLESLEDEAGGEPDPPARPVSGKKRKLCIRVTDLRNGKVKVNLSVPAGLIKRLPAIMPKEARLAARGIDFDELIEGMAFEDAPQKIVDVVGEEDGERVEIFIE